MLEIFMWNEDTPEYLARLDSGTVIETLPLTPGVFLRPRRVVEVNGSPTDRLREPITETPLLLYKSKSEKSSLLR